MVFFYLFLLIYFIFPPVQTLGGNQQIVSFATQPHPSLPPPLGELMLYPVLFQFVKSFL